MCYSVLFRGIFVQVGDHILSGLCLVCFSFFHFS